MEEFAVIVAGGSGTRLKSKLPKQFIEIGSLPVLMHTINQFRSYSPAIQIILVLPENQITTWQALCEKHHFSIENLNLVKGGDSRYQSCKNGISSINAPAAIVAIHDGVRPFVSKEVIKKGFDLAKTKGTAICCIECKDSARYLDEINNTNSSLIRSRIRLIQTPQIFDLNILKKSYLGSELDIFTDDASVVEYAGFPINLFEGEPVNIKITTADDLIWAEIFLKKIIN
jgi:2-C-methyl-D-erythritol 4-phosphate cytidylyltransferase